MSDLGYDKFLASKLARAVPTGIADPEVESEHLFPFQRDIVRWALRRGRCALFADTGLGKTRMQLEWAHAVACHAARPVLILTPLAVAAQTSREAETIGIGVALAREQSEADGLAIAVTNYDRLHRFDPSAFGAVVLDESSCLKDYTAATRNQLIEAFRDTPFKLCCTATPSPNDFTELGNHAEFLGVLTRAEMLAQWFVHDGGSTQDWRLKGHAEQDFWRWVCSWGLMVKRPSDLGYDDGAFELPPLEMHEHRVPGDLAQAHAAGQLFVSEAKTLQEQRAARRASLGARVTVAADLVSAEPAEQWLCWCELNAEADALVDAINDAEVANLPAQQVAGSDERETKEDRMLGFVDGHPWTMVTKPSIAGHGMNWQHCARVLFVGVSHSFEQFYQAIRRCWRFGQGRPVHVHVIVSEAEGPVLANLKRKQADAERMGDEMRQHTIALVREAVGSSSREGTAYEPTVEMKVPTWLKETT